MLTKDEFVELVSRRTGVSDRNLDASSRLGTDLELDSFGLLELASSLTELGVKLDERSWLSTETLGDLYDRYRARKEADTGSVVPDALPTARQPARHPGDASPADGEPAPPRVAGQFFRLVPILPPAVPFLYSLAISPDVGFRWRYRGAVPTPQQFEQELWQPTLLQFLVESIQTGQPAGHLICYNPDFSLGHAYVAAAMSGQYARTGIAAEPVRLFMSYVFDVWPFRKLYLEMPEFNFQQFASAAGRTLHVEARLRGHDYYRGRRWDRLILAAYRPGADTPAFDDEFVG